VIGEATGDGRLVLEDATSTTGRSTSISRVILGKPPKMLRDVGPPRRHAPAARYRGGIELADAARARVLQLPAVADKTFLITITDRSVTGLVARDQMVGPYQVPSPTAP
jgi:phosphoribosylformylglycinamidine synthase